MKTGQIPGLEKPVSRIVQGCMMLRSGDGQAWTNALLDAALASGINAFDHSHIYGGGNCERAFGEWMRLRGNREAVVIVGKGCHHDSAGKRVTPAHIDADIAGSLERLGVDCIDLWMFHRDDPAQPVGPLMEALARHVEAGRIGTFGGSNWRHDRIEAAMAYCTQHGLPGFAASSPNYSLAEQIDSPWGDDCITISGPANQPARDWYVATGLPVLAWSSLARGFFSGRISRANYETTRALLEEHAIRCYVCEENWKRLDRLEQLAAEKGVTVPQLALAYVLTDPMNMFALVGAQNAAEMEANAAVVTLALSDAERRWLDLKSGRP